MDNAVTPMKNLRMSFNPSSGKDISQSGGPSIAFYRNASARYVAPLRCHSRASGASPRMMSTLI